GSGEVGGDGSETGLATTKNGRKKSTTGIGVSFTPDFRDKEKQNLITGANGAGRPPHPPKGVRRPPPKGKGVISGRFDQRSVALLRRLLRDAKL
ncbi:hypothetical protein LSAT2_020449, partial [Lamellibrachia satsuma]